MKLSFIDIPIYFGCLYQYFVRSFPVDAICLVVLIYHDLRHIFLDAGSFGAMTRRSSLSISGD